MLSISIIKNLLNGETINYGKEKETGKRQGSGTVD
jgi:hypothetical protein